MPVIGTQNVAFLLLTRDQRIQNTNMLSILATPMNPSHVNLIHHTSAPLVTCMHCHYTTHNIHMWDMAKQIVLVSLATNVIVHGWCTHDKGEWFIGKEVFSLWLVHKSIPVTKESVPASIETTACGSHTLFCHFPGLSDNLIPYSQKYWWEEYSAIW